MPDNKLTLKFDPGTIEHLGIKMYSQLPQALAELVANAYDADASEVIIKLYDADHNKKKIIVSDNGHGMSYDDVRDKFLVIGRNRRPDDGALRTTPKGRVITGRKGLGKLALFGIGNTITIETTQAGQPTKTIFSMNWKKIIGKEPVAEGEPEQPKPPLGTIQQYHPDEEIVNKMDVSEQGTIITLTELKRESNFNLMEAAVALSKMFNTIGNGFKVVLCQNDDVEHQIELTRELRYEGMEHEFIWNVENDIVPNINTGGYENANKIKGWIVSSPENKTMPVSLRGITLYVNGRLANAPSFFGLGQTPHAFSYLSGWIDADFLDEYEDDLIATDRQSLSWDLPEAEKLQTFLQKIVRYVEKAWEEGRRQKKKDELSTRVGINVDDWVGTMSDDLGKKVVGILSETIEKPEIGMETNEKVAKLLFALVPKYPEFHWRNLHPEIQSVSETQYQNEDFYGALFEATKKYVNAVRTKVAIKNHGATLPVEDRSMVGKAFGQETTKTLKIFLNAVQSDGTPFPAATISSLEDSQMLLSQGIITGFRNPIGHAVCKELSESEVITELNCLDALSLLSLLFHRLDDAEMTPGYTGT